MLARHPAPYSFHSVPLLAVWTSAERPHVCPAAILVPTFTLAAATLPTSPGTHIDFVGSFYNGSSFFLFFLSCQLCSLP